MTIIRYNNDMIYKYLIMYLVYSWRKKYITLLLFYEIVILLLYAVDTHLMIK